MADFPEVIGGGGLELRRRHPTFEDAVTMFGLVDKNRARLGRWLAWVDNIKTPEDCYDRLKKSEEKGARMYFIFEDDRVRGRVGFVGVNEKDRSLELGYLLDADAVGKGVVVRAVKLLEREAFGNGWEVIRIKCDAQNEKSVETAKRLGYIFEGTLRHDDVYPDGRVCDNMFFSKLKSEWEKENA